jgi:hypothetical protein
LNSDEFRKEMGDFDNDWQSANKAIVI